MPCLSPYLFCTLSCLYVPDWDVPYRFKNRINRFCGAVLARGNICVLVRGYVLQMPGTIGNFGCYLPFGATVHNF
jgi:hypothetical protein